ncbi:MAG TPA: hypothetical protein VIK91_19150 [Nannocystis sp.]
MTTSQPLMDALYSQHSAEAAAVQAYDRALQKFRGQPEQAALERLRADHEEAVGRLGALIRRHGGVEPEATRDWRSALTGVLEGVASLVSDEAPLRVLHRIEVAGAEGYARLLADPLLAPDVVAELQVLLERNQDHTGVLEEAIAEVPETPNRPMI